MQRIHNFCAGPCTLPVSVLEEVQAELLNHQATGMSIMEMSHRSAHFEALHEETLALAQQLIGAPKHFKALLLPGGAHHQFVMSAMNFLANGGTAGFIDSGVWGKKAQQEAASLGHTVTLWSGAATAYRDLPRQVFSQEALRYLHLTSNETVNGLQFHDFPETPACDWVIDASSDYYTRDLPWHRCLMVYGGVQKNLAPSGLALVFIREDALEPLPQLPPFMTYHAHAQANSLYNTPPTFQIYVLNKVLKWMEALGGIAYFEAASRQKSQALYDYIDRSDFYHNAIAADYRSRTNVIFNTPSPELDKRFQQQAEAAGLSGLKGHRIVGGLRASLYNALTMSTVEALLAFMKDFEAKS